VEANALPSKSYGTALGDSSDKDSILEEIPEPPHGFGPFPTIKELQEAINNWAKPRGFAVNCCKGRNKSNLGEY